MEGRAVILRGEDVVGWNIRIADSFLSRLTGLLPTKRLGPGDGLLIKPCRQIHTWFMSMPIDVIFLDDMGVIFKLLPEVAPWKISPMVRGSSQALELPAGSISTFSLVKGEKLDILIT